MADARPFFTRIESLRGLGCLAVAGYHISGLGLNGIEFLPHHWWTSVSNAQNLVGKFLLQLFPGRSALMMFFAISGFVLYVSLQYGPQTFGAAAKRFLIARAFRIYPIVFVGVLIAGWLQGWHGAANSGRETEVLGSAMIVANMLLLDAAINPTLWALQVEVLMAPVILLLYFVDRAYGPRVLLGVALVTTALSFSKDWALFRPLSANMFAFILGMLIPTLGRRWAVSLSRRASNIWLLVAVVLMFVHGPLFGFYTQWAGVFEAYTAVVLLSIVAYRTDVWGTRFLDHWTVRGLGLSSGSYYVLHMQAVTLPAMVAALCIPAAWSFSMPLLVGAIVVPLSLIAITPLAVLSYHLVEAPGIALGRQVLRSRRLVAAE